MIPFKPTQLILFVLIATLPGISIADDALVAAYERAAHIHNADHHKVFRNLNLHPRWIDGHDAFWYQRETTEGVEFVLVDAAEASKAPAFDHRRLARALGRELDKEVDAADIPIRGLKIDLDAGTASFGAYGKQWSWNLRRNRLSESDTTPTPPNWRLSPDGKLALYAKEHNLWVHDIESGEDRQLTDDGMAFYAYGTVPDATGRPAVKPEAIWSLDSKRILTVQTDDRQVKDLPMITFVPEDGSVRPTAWARRTALPGDEHVTTFRMTAIDATSGKQVSAHYPGVPAVRMNDTPVGGGWAWWGADGVLAYFVDLDRGEKNARVIEFNTDTGTTRTVFTETAENYVEMGSNVYMPTAITPLPDSNEVVWYSERSGWAHLYLYDLATGRMKRQLTDGEWLVRDILGVDHEARKLFISLGGRVAGRNPYHREIASVGIDDGELTILSSSDDDHLVWQSGDFGLLILSFLLGEDISTISGVSPSGRYFVETVTRVDGLPRADLRTTGGDLIMTVQEATAPGLPDNWNWPEPVSLVAADGETEIRGAVFRPTDFDPNKTYPVIDHVYGGPQVSLVPEMIGAMAFGTAQPLAELGFVVVVIDGRGTTERSRAFHEASYGAAHTASNLEDHIAGIRQLAERYPYMDIERVGITGFSGGGYMTGIGMLRFGDFYKVGVAGAGNFDQRLFWHSWGERYHGKLDGDNYLPQAALTYADQLQGDLLFIHGLLDHGVHPGGLFQLTQALMDANKKFELVLMPKAGHELPGYAMVRMWDFFVEHLAGITPPPDYSTKSSTEHMREKMAEMAAEASGQ